MPTLIVKRATSSAAILIFTVDLPRFQVFALA
jgi:hypothetical protein